MLRGAVFFFLMIHDHGAAHYILGLHRVAGAGGACRDPYINPGADYPLSPLFDVYPGVNALAATTFGPCHLGSVYR